jgi:hypothetical protein
MNEKLNSFFTLKENFSTHEPPKPSSHLMSHDRTGRYKRKRNVLGVWLEDGDGDGYININLSLK